MATTGDPGLSNEPVDASHAFGVMVGNQNVQHNTYQIQGSAPLQWIEGSIIFGSVTIVGAVDGDVAISAEPPLYRVDSFPLPLEPPSVTQARERPSRLLGTRYEAVPFAGRKEQIRLLTSWRESKPQLDATASAILLHGPGGQGKTRLAAQLAHESAHAGWRTLQGRLPHTPAPHGPLNPATSSSNDILMVVDYAERWPHASLLALLEHAAFQRGRRTRVVLISRTAGPWWQGLSDRLEEFGVPTARLNLPPLSVEIGRYELYISARNRFADLLNAPAVKNQEAPALLRDDTYDQVLAIHMAALATVDSHLADKTAPRDPVSISAHLLRRERAYWNTLRPSPHGAASNSASVMGRVVYTACLIGPRPYREAAEALSHIGAAPSAADAQTWLDDHTTCYPPTGDDLALEPLLPDTLAEDFIGLSTPGHGHADVFHPDPWARGAVGALLAPGHEKAAWARDALNVLVNAAPRWPHLTEFELAPLLLRNPRLAVLGGGAVLSAISSLVANCQETLEAIAPHLPPPGTDGDLLRGAVSIMQLLTRHGLQTTSDPMRRATIRNTMSKYLLDSSMIDEALESCQASLEEIGEPNIDAHPQLAGQWAHALHLKAAIGSQSGRDDDSAAPLEQAVSIYRQLPDSESALARALSDLGVSLSERGEHASAAANEAEALAIRQRIATGDPQTRTRELGDSWNNLAAHLWATGQEEEALSGALKAVEIRRELAQTNSEDDQSNLAMSLENTAIFLIRKRHSDNALALAQEALTIRRQLAATSPFRFEQRLGVSLARFAQTSMAVKRSQANALASVAEALVVCGRLCTRERRASFRHLSNLGALDRCCEVASVILQVDGRDEDAALARRIRSTLRFLGGGPPPRTFRFLAELLEHLGRTADAEEMRSWASD